MESDQYSRIIFINMDDLQKISLNKLEQVCDGAYVFVDREAKVVPFNLVQELQHLGDSVKWVAIDGKTPDSVANYISFFMGGLHEQLEKEVEFAIISENEAMDNLIQYLNEKGRSCIRVTNKREQEQTKNDQEELNWSENKIIKDKLVVNELVVNEVPLIKKRVVVEPIPEKVERVVEPVVLTQIPVINSKPSNGKIKTTNGNGKVSVLPEKVARETIKRLVLSGNRPEALESLKSYILLQYNSQEVTQQIDTIIDKMEKTKDIKVQNEAVVYNF